MLERNNYLLFIRLILITIWCAACGGSGNSVVDTSTAINPDDISFKNDTSIRNAYSINYPSDWLTGRSPESSEKVTVHAAFNEEREDESDRYLENIMLVSGELIHEGALPAGLSNLVITSSSKETIGNHDTEIEIGKYDYTLSSGETLNLAYMTILIELHGKLYGLQYTAELRRFNTYTDVAKKMVESWLIGTVIEGTGDTAQGHLYTFDYGPVSVTNNNDVYIVTHCIVTEFHRASVLAKIMSKDGAILKELIIADDVTLSAEKKCAGVSPKSIFDGVNFIVTYSDNITSDKYSRASLFAKRVSVDGHIIDDTPIYISTLGNNSNNSAYDITFDGNQTIIVWYDYTIESVDIRYRKILATFISPNGTVSSPFIIHESRNSRETASNPSVTSNNNSILISWLGRHGLELTEISFDGNLLLSEPISPMPDNGSSHHSVIITPSDSEFLISWWQSDGIHAQRISNGELILSNSSTDTRLIPAIDNEELYLENTNYFNGYYEIVYRMGGNIYTSKTDPTLSSTDTLNTGYPANTSCCDHLSVTTSHLSDTHYLTLYQLDHGRLVGWL